MKTNVWDEKPPDGINNNLDTAEKKIGELEDMAIEIVQNETPKEKNFRNE